MINFFFGVAMNAAMTVGLTVANTVNHFGANVMVAFRPQIIKNYSQGNKDGMKNLTILAIKVIMFIYCLVAVPVFVEAENLLKIWLVEVPDHTVVFCRLFLISIFFETIRYVLIIDIHATGNVKWVSFFSGTLFLLAPFVTYLLLRLGISVNSAITTIIVCNILLCMINTYLIKHYVKIPVSSYAATILRVILTSALALFLAEYIKKFIQPFGVYLPAVHKYGKSHILGNVQHGNEIVELVNKSHLSAAEYRKLLLILRVNVLAVHVDLSACGSINTAENVEKCGLSRTRRAYYCEKLTLIHRERNSVKSVDFVFALAVYLA